MEPEAFDPAQPSDEDLAYLNSGHPLARPSRRDSCGHGTTNVEVMPPGSQHYGKEMCSDCGKFVRWVPAPDCPAENLIIPDCEVSAPVCQLVGTPKQVSWADMLRRERLPQLQAKGQTDPTWKKLAAAARQISDASWWIANRNCNLAAIRWPTQWRSGASPAPSAPPRPPRPGRERPARPDLEEAQLQPRSFSVEIEQEGEMHVMHVMFDGRSGGTLRLTEGELRQMGKAVNRVLNAIDQARGRSFSED